MHHCDSVHTSPVAFEKSSVISTVRPTVHTNPSRKRKNLKTPFIHWFADGKHFENGASRKRWRHDIIISSGAPATPSTTSGAQYQYKKEKETHDLIFSWLWWLAVLLMSAYARRRQRRRSGAGVAQHGGHTRAKRLTETCILIFSVPYWYWTPMLWSIDTCQKKISAD